MGSTVPFSGYKRIAPPVNRAAERRRIKAIAAQKRRRIRRYKKVGLSK